jgi:hypothetical protein
MILLLQHYLFRNYDDLPYVAFPIQKLRWSALCNTLCSEITMIFLLQHYLFRNYDDLPYATFPVQKLQWFTFWNIICSETTMICLLKHYLFRNYVDLPYATFPVQKLQWFSFCNIICSETTVICLLKHYLFTNYVDLPYPTFPVRNYDDLPTQRSVQKLRWSALCNILCSRTTRTTFVNLDPSRKLKPGNSLDNTLQELVSRNKMIYWNCIVKRLRTNKVTLKCDWRQNSISLVRQATLRNMAHASGLNKPQTMECLLSTNKRTRLHRQQISL